MIVAYCQTRPKFGQIKRNLDDVLERLSECGADLVVLPELPFSGYHFKDREEALSLAEEPENSATVTALVDICKSKGFSIVTGFAERCGDKCYNSALLLDASGVVAIYRKIHLFSREKICFDPGDLPLAVYDVAGVKVGMMICFDWAFPEVARTLAMKGAQVLCHPSNLVLVGYCQRAMVTRCQENRIFAITANRVGEEVRPHGSLHFTGRSQIVEPNGRLRFRAPSKRACLQQVEINQQLALDKNITPYNDVLADRRTEFYQL
ncbi:MAG: nitrilase-related carbon-nitrogen hydrolase [Candidatus Porifericomitaceae bacterium WSBS_2022_MAG_OTU9]